jgi:hypothetical protein
MYPRFPPGPELDVDADVDDVVAAVGVDPPGPVDPVDPADPAALVLPVVREDDPDEAPAPAPVGAAAAVVVAQVKVGRGSCMSIVPGAAPLGSIVEVWKETRLASL